jgi:HSP20 family protein
MNENIFELLEKELGTLFKTERYLPIEIKETENNYIVNVEIPGVKRENINLYYEKGLLIIKIKKEKQEKAKYSEIQYGELIRKIPMSNINENTIMAENKNGILEIKFEKKENIKKIEIK